MSNIKQWFLKEYSEDDIITRERAWVLLLTDTAIALLTFMALFASGLFRTIPFGADLTAASTLFFLGALVSMAAIRSGSYTTAAHITVVFSVVTIWYLNIRHSPEQLVKSEMSYAVAVITLPALLLGRTWTVLYTIASLFLTAYMTYRLAQTGRTSFDTVVGFAIDHSITIIFVAFFSTLISSAYERAVHRVRSLLEEQQKTSTALANFAILLEQAEVQKRQFYRDTISSVTEGKLMICDEQDVRQYMESAELILEASDAASASAARRRVMGYLESNGLRGDELYAFTLASGEAINNGVKHAGYTRIHAGRKESVLWVGVEDNGPGMESLALPKAVLLRGYSTKPSLGLGYSIMLDVSDHMLLKTDPTGTTVIMIKDLKARTLKLSLDNLQDAWKSLPD